VRPPGHRPPQRIGPCGANRISTSEVMYRARAFKDELRSRAFRGSATGACARVPADQSTRLTIRVRVCRGRALRKRTSRRQGRRGSLPANRALD
jgi:hypothetical protein